MPLLLSPRFWMAVAVLALLGAFGSLCYRAGGAADREALAEYKTSQAEQRLLADRAREQRNAARQAAVDKEARDGQAKIAFLESSLAESRAAGERLRDAIRATAGSAGPHSSAATAGQGQPGSDPIGLFAELLQRADARAERVSEYADRLAIAGQSCERSYDALSVTPAADR